MRVDEPFTTIIEKTPGSILGGQLTPEEKIKPYLVVVSGVDQGRQFPLTKVSTILGRDKSADIELIDSKVSRKHAAIVIDNEQIVLEDFQSTNGSYVNEQRITRRLIDAATRIRLGGTIIKIEYKNAIEAELEHAIYLAANSDPLTKLSNRRAFFIRADEEFAFFQRSQHPMTIVMADIDHFKQINDQYGHPTGDFVLYELAKLMQDEMRKEDLLARYGGEEFIMLLRNTDRRAAMLWAERMREKVEQYRFNNGYSSLKATLSIGLFSSENARIRSLEEMILKADQALYYAKKSGRNRVVMSNDVDQLLN